MPTNHNDNWSEGNSPPLLPAVKAFASIGIGRTRCYEILNAGKVPAVKLGKKTLVRAHDFAVFIDNLPPYVPAKAA